jgi:glyoxylase-like metal-dependent hydrolase (beta-lactamase superfamily II)|tara:strand:- start:2551 stop:3231 length:681 start_codon:yes stop_codon:yes gene_type:complete
MTNLSKIVTADVVYEDEGFRIERLREISPFGNNSYIISASNEIGSVIVVDAPLGSESTVQAIGDRDVQALLFTHHHGDHWQGFETLRAMTMAPAYAGATEINLDPEKQIEPIAEGQIFKLGTNEIVAMHTPGHTPGSTCFLVGGAVLTGDVLFPGGPGLTGSNDDLLTSVESITSRLHPLAPQTVVLPGHGGTTTIFESRWEYAIFAEKPWNDSLKGDVLWLSEAV